MAEQLKKKAATENETAIAQAEADAVKLAADAEAYRLEQIGKHLTDKTILNTLADNWNGELPGVIGAGAAGILNLDEMVKGSAGE